jgi:hypothetical protein
MSWPTFEPSTSQIQVQAYNIKGVQLTYLSLHCELGCILGVLSDTTLTPLSVKSVSVSLLLDFLVESLL